jgi:hypothetical protein
MWSTIERLPADVVSQKVLSMLNYGGIIRLDTAMASTNSRPVLHDFLKMATVELPMYRLEGRMNVQALQWCVVRHLQIESFYVKASFCEIIMLLSSVPTIVRGEITISCSGQADLDEIESTVHQAHANGGFDFSFSLHLNGNLKFHHSGLFLGRLSGLSTSLSTLSAEDTMDLISGNPQISTIHIAKATVAELQLVASLGSALQVLRLQNGDFTDEQLAVLSQGCNNVRHLQLRSSSVTRLLDIGLIAMAPSLRELRILLIYNISVSDAAVVALCRHCAKLQHMHISGGFLTAAAVTALTTSRAPLTGMNISWKVASPAVLTAAMDAGALRGMTSLSIVSIRPEYAATLEIALSRMAALKSFSLFQDQLPEQMRPTIPVQVLTSLGRQRSALTSVHLSCQLSGNLDSVLECIFRGCPALTSFACCGAGAVITDQLMLCMAEHCKGLAYISCRLSPTISGAAMATLVRECKNLDWLYLEGGIDVTDAMLFLLAEHCATVLNALYLQDSVHITAPAVLHVLQRCPVLDTVRIPTSVGTTEEAAEMVRILQARGGGSTVYDLNPVDL